MNIRRLLVDSILVSLIIKPMLQLQTTIFSANFDVAMLQVDSAEDSDCRKNMRDLNKSVTCNRELGI